MAIDRRHPEDVSFGRYGRPPGHLQHQGQSLPPDRADGIQEPTRLHQRISYPRGIRSGGSEKMAVIDDVSYGKLLARAVPRVI